MQRFLLVGRGGLCEHEFLELLLFYAMPRKDTKPLAKIDISLLDHFIVSGEKCYSFMKIGKNND